MEIAILGLLTNGKAQHKINLIGRPYQSGPLESRLGVTFRDEDRQLADRAFEGLKARSLISPTYGDLINPEQWVVITPAGQQALERQALDELDTALYQIAPHLVEVRAGAWEAANDSRPDSLRQAAHSGRELIHRCDSRTTEFQIDRLVHALRVDWPETVKTRRKLWEYLTRRSC